MFYIRWTSMISVTDASSIIATVVLWSSKINVCQVFRWSELSKDFFQQHLINWWLMIFIIVYFKHFLTCLYSIRWFCTFILSFSIFLEKLIKHLQEFISWRTVFNVIYDIDSQNDKRFPAYFKLTWIHQICLIKFQFQIQID